MTKFVFHRVFILLIFIFSFILTNAYSSIDYHIVVDGGGSSSTLQILDSSGNVLQLSKGNGEKKMEIVGGCANINTVGVEGLTAVFHQLFDDVLIGATEPLPFENIISRSELTLGLAGMGLKKTEQVVEDILKSFGFTSDQLYLHTDVGLALKLVKKSGAVLIAGTGSICFGKKEGELFRCGGLGRILGDEGSGYRIGLKAIQCAIEQECGWGKDSIIYDKISHFFGHELLASVIGPIQRGEISPETIASITPWVFEAAYDGDLVCSEILNQAADDLGRITSHVLGNLEEKEPIVYLIGGVFKNKHASQFIRKIASSFHIQKLEKHPVFVNISDTNYATEVVREQLLASQDPDGLLGSLPFIKGDFRAFSTIYGLKTLTTEKSKKNRDSQSYLL